MKQTRFVLMLMYDLPMIDRKSQKAYRQLSRYLQTEGFYLLQQSIYIKPLAEKHRAKRYLTAIEKMAVTGSHIRAITLTHQTFKTMSLIKGEFSFNERLIKQPNGIICF